MLRDDGAQRVPVWVLSLADAQGRRAAMQRHLEGLGIAFEFMDAVRGSALDAASRAQLNPAGNMSPGALGCYLSHLAVYRRMVEEGEPVALVLEDDALLHPGVRPLLQHGPADLDFDYCFLGSEDRGDEGFVFYNRRSARPLAPGLQAFSLSSGPYCTHAYLVTLAGARKRLACAEPARTAIDHYHHLPYRPRFRAVIPMLAFVNEHSAMASMSSASWSALQAWARQHWWYYPLRDALKWRGLAKRLALRRSGLGRNGDWGVFRSSFCVPRVARLWAGSAAPAPLHRG